MYAIIGTFLVEVSAALAAEAPDTGHEQQCFRKMRQIFEAAQSYRRLHNGAYPERLQQLIDAGLISRELVICPRILESLPYSGRPGGTWTSGEEGLEASLSYQYELVPKAIGSEVLPVGTAASWRQVKLLQATRRGWEDVPLLRCERHSESASRLNLTFAGRTYRSGVNWEELFVDAIPYTYRTPYLTLNGPAPPFPRQSGLNNRPRHCLPLDEVSNALPTDPWWWGSRTWVHNQQTQQTVTLEPLLLACRDSYLNLAGSVYDVHSLIQLQGASVPAEHYRRGFTVRAFPQSRDISVGRTFSKADVLCGTVWEEDRGRISGRLIWHYDGEQRDELQLVTGENIDCFQRDPNPQFPAKPAWSGRSPGGPCHLYKISWTNSRPARLVTKATFVADQESTAAPFIIAINLHP
jgi:hypothetical protein